MSDVCNNRNYKQHIDKNHPALFHRNIHDDHTNVDHFLWTSLNFFSKTQFDMNKYSMLNMIGSVRKGQDDLQEGKLKMLEKGQKMQIDRWLNKNSSSVITRVYCLCFGVFSGRKYKNIPIARIRIKSGCTCFVGVLIIRL